MIINNGSIELINKLSLQLRDKNNTDNPQGIIQTLEKIKGLTSSLLNLVDDHLIHNESGCYEGSIINK